MPIYFTSQSINVNRTIDRLTLPKGVKSALNVYTFRRINELDVDCIENVYLLFRLFFSKSVVQF